MINFILVLLTGLGWGLLSVGSKAVYSGTPSVDAFSLTVARSAWALPLFLLVLAVSWYRERPQISRKQWLLIVGAALFYGPLVTLMFSLASSHTSVAHISFLIGISPVTNTAVAALVFRTGLGARSMIALALGIIGVAILAISQQGDSGALLGDVLMLFWLAGFAGYACCLRAVGPSISPTTLMGIVGALSTILVVVPGVIVGYTGGIAGVLGSVSGFWWFFGVVVLLAMIIGQTTYAAAVKRMGVSIATIGSEYTALAVGTAASLLLHESWTVLTVVAGLLFCCALAVTFVGGTREARATGA